MHSFLAKRLMDIFLSFFGIIASLPIWLIISVLICSEDKGPIYYTQERIGKNGRIFKAIKFRSMIPHAEEGLGPIQARVHDSRSTRIGGILRPTAMDELPQLLNILRGDMSFVGPRALRPDEVEVKTKTHTGLISRPDLKIRHSVTPGLTGVAQVFAPRDIPLREKVKYDIWYIKNQSIILDIWLIFVSFCITFLGTWEIRSKKLPFLDSASLKN